MCHRILLLRHEISKSRATKPGVFVGFFVVLVEVAVDMVVVVVMVVIIGVVVVGVVVVPVVVVVVFVFFT